MIKIAISEHIICKEFPEGMLCMFIVLHKIPFANDIQRPRSPLLHVTSLQNSLNRNSISSYKFTIKVLLSTYDLELGIIVYNSYVIWMWRCSACKYSLSNFIPITLIIKIMTFCFNRPIAFAVPYWDSLLKSISDM